jgi:AAA domain
MSKAVVGAQTHRDQITKQFDQVYRAVLHELSSDRAVVVVRAPPGSGKTHLLSQAVSALRKQQKRICVAAQTNAQADDICHRLASAPWGLSCYRFVRRDGGMDEPNANVTEVSSFDDLPHTSCIVVSTAAKWGFAEIKDPFDVLLVDEAWQMQWSQFVPLGRIAPRFVLIGDPGQIPPVVTVDTSRWETAILAPHLPAPEIICGDRNIVRGVTAVELTLPASRRLPADTVSLIQPFYDFRFDAWALPHERSVVTTDGASDQFAKTVSLLSEGSVVGATIPTVEDLPPADMDTDVANAVVGLATKLLAGKSYIRMLDADKGQQSKRIQEADIAVTATHRAMNELIGARLRSSGLDGIRVDTPERWQGLQRLVTIAVHPLSGVLRPTAFDLETGRLCVMSSRHQGGLIVVGRDHIGDTLDGMIVTADQPIGRPDISGRGHQQHLAFWGTLADKGRITSL